MMACSMTWRAQNGLSSGRFGTSRLLHDRNGSFANCKEKLGQQARDRDGQNVVWGASCGARARNVVMAQNFSFPPPVIYLA